MSAPFIVLYKSGADCKLYWGFWVQISTGEKSLIHFSQAMFNVPWAIHNTAGDKKNTHIYMYTVNFV